jgi:hypothetical protein
LPSHPELLDWLAVDFRESGWDVKRLIRMIVTSSTYRQSARTTEQKLERSTRKTGLFARGPRFRMDAEMIRDYMLQTSGLLSAKIGGPSVKPYQPEGVWEAVAMIGSNTRDYRQDEGENLYRRSLYTFWKRSAPPASMDIFNAPSREVCTIRRDRTNTPLQALATLNDPQSIEAARSPGDDRDFRNSSEPEVRIDQMARRVLARTLEPRRRRRLWQRLDCRCRTLARSLCRRRRSDCGIDRGRRNAGRPMEIAANRIGRLYDVGQSVDEPWMKC